MMLFDQKSDELIPMPPPLLSSHLVDYLVFNNKSWVVRAFVSSPLKSTASSVLCRPNNCSIILF